MLMISGNAVVVGVLTLGVLTLGVLTVGVLTVGVSVNLPVLVSYEVVRFPELSYGSATSLS